MRLARRPPWTLRVAAPWILAALLLAGLAWWRYGVILQAERDYRERGLRGTASFSAQVAEGWVRERLADVRYLAARAADVADRTARRGLPQAAALRAVEGDMLQLVRTKEYSDAWLVSEEGRVLASAKRTELSREEEAAIAAYRCGDGPPAVGVLADHAKPRAIVLTMQPTEERGRGGCRSVVVLRSDLLALLQPYLQPRPRLSAVTGYTLLVRRTASGAAVLAAPNDGPLVRRDFDTANVPPLIAQVIAGQYGPLTATDVRGVAVLAMASQIPSIDWIVVRQMDVGEYMPAIREQTFAEVTLAILVILVVVWIRRADRRALRIQQLDADLTRVQLQALRAQLQPHFLFNVLNGIGELVHRDPEAAERTLMLLARLLRLSLSTGARHEVSLEQELTIVRTYVDLERIRHGDRFTFEVDAPEVLHETLVPPFVLQPLIENAFKHGLRTVGTAIRLSVGVHGSQLRLTVANRTPAEPQCDVPCQGASFPSDEPAKGLGIGLTNTRLRLERLYGTPQRVDVTSGADGWTRVVVEVPLRRPT